MRRLTLVIDAATDEAVEDALTAIVETAGVTDAHGTDTAMTDVVTSDAGIDARVSWRWETDSPAGRLVVLTDADERDLAAVLDDAYGYRIGDADPNEVDDLEEMDAEGVARVRRLARQLGMVDPTA